MSLLECHATGTPIGDATELRSMAKVFAGCSGVPIGSLKSNLGHLITAAGVAGLIKVLAAMEHGKKPPTLHVDQPNAAVEGTPFRLLRAGRAVDRAEARGHQRVRLRRQQRAPHRRVGRGDRPLCEDLHGS